MKLFKKIFKKKKKGGESKSKKGITAQEENAPDAVESRSNPACVSEAEDSGCSTGSSMDIGPPEQFKKAQQQQHDDMAVGTGTVTNVQNLMSNGGAGGGGSNPEERRVSYSNNFRRSSKIPRGYSSGASSVSGSDLDDDISLGDDELGGNRNSLSKHSAILDLGALRQEMITDGDLTKTVVRIETPFGVPIEEIYEGVHDGPVLGSGVSGIVRLAIHRATGVKYAVKCLDIGLIDNAEGLRQLRDEIFIMCQLDHPNIVRIEEVYESTSEIYIVQELCVGGDLFDRLDEQPDFHYTEVQCARLVKQMLSAIRYLHSKGIIHRDLKLENFLFSSAEATSELKMIDFGLSKHFELGQHHHEKVGTPYTVAPEIIRGAYDEKSDIWALGVITYLLFSGETPFGGLDGENLLLVKKNIMAAQLSFEPADIWENVSATGKAFVVRLLNPDPKKRPTAKETQKDDWIQIWGKKDANEGRKLNPRLVGALMSFKEYSDMQKLLSEVLSFTLLPEQIAGLREEFEKMDSNGDGEITLSALKTVLLENAEAGSLGALTEQEIEDIFDSIRIRKSEPTIRWHEFLAAGLSQAQVDDRNLRLAFDRLDTDRKGFVTFEDLEDVLGGSSSSYGELEKIWIESLKVCGARLDRITYEDFKSLMKGQSSPGLTSASGRTGRRTTGGGVATTSTSSIELPGVPEDKQQEVLQASNNQTSTSLLKLDPEKSLGTLQEEETSVVSGASTASGNFTRSRSKSFNITGSGRSMWDEDSSSLDSSSNPIYRDSARALNLKGSGDSADFNRSWSHFNASKDMSSPLMANRALYRKHREMRLAVIEASKAFDKKRTQRQYQKEMAQAGLIMRRGSMTPVPLDDQHTRTLFDAASKRCGRARKTRNKTVSDVTGMLLKAEANEE